MKPQSSISDDFTLTLGGASYRFHWGLAEVIEMQERLTTPLEVPSVQDMDLGVRRGRLKYLRAMIFAGLREHQPLITEAKVTELMQQTTEDEMTALLAAFGYSVTPDPEDVEVLKKHQHKPRRNPRKAQTVITTGAGSISAPDVSG
jgi:hypothetical protein